MKTLHVFHHSNLLNGVDRTTLTLVRALTRQGVAVHALVPRPGDVTAALMQMGVPYRVADLGCCAGPAKLAELAYLSRTASRAREIEEWVREELFDLVHINTGHVLDAAIAAARSGVPAIWHIHAPFEVDFERYSGFMAPEGYAWLLGELGCHVIAVSDDVRASLLPHLPADKVSTLYNGIDVDDLESRAREDPTSIRAELGLSPDTPLVTGVGRISGQKDFATFVRVANRVVASHPRACFVIAGPAEDRALARALEEQVTALGLSHRVFILGPRNDVPTLLSQSNAFLSTAIFEGQGLAALEALVLGRPVVAMGCVGLRECLRHEVDSLVVPLGDEGECAAAVERLLADDGLARTLAARGRDSVVERYSATAYAAGFLSIAEAVLARHRPKSNVGVASFALGLLDEIQEIHSRLLPARRSQRGLARRLAARCRDLFGRAES